MEILLHTPDKITVSNTAYADDKGYTLKAPGDRYLLISQISFGADGNFLSNGKIKLRSNGKFTETGADENEFGLISNFTYEFGEKDFFYISPNNKIEIFHKIASGTGVVQYFITGTLLTEEEFNQVKKKYLGVN